MSSLVQVFGTLVAADVIFLVLRYQEIGNKINAVARKLGETLFLLKQFSDTTEVPKGSDYVKIGLWLSGFLACDHNRREGLYTMTVDEAKIKQRSATCDKLKNGIELADMEMEQYRAHLRTLNNIPRLVVKMMGLPAGASLLFAALLGLADHFKQMGLLNGSSVVSIIVSGMALVLLVRWARKSFEICG